MNCAGENHLVFYNNAWNEHVESNSRFKCNEKLREIFKFKMEEDAYTTFYELLLVTWRDFVLRPLGHKVN